MWAQLRERGYEIVFAAAPDRWAERLGELGEFRPLELARGADPRSARGAAQLRALLLEQPWAFVQVQSPIAAALVRLLPRRAPLVYVAHGLHFHADGRPLPNAAFRAVETALATRTDHLALVSREDHDVCAAGSIGRRTRLWHLPGAGVEVAGSSLRRPADGPQRLAVFVGELNANKDPETAVRAVAALRRTDPRWRLELYGEGPLRRSLEAEHASDWCRFEGHSDQVRERLGHAHALLAPSHREGLPRVVVEALATGLPVVARSNRGTRELLAGIGAVVAAGAGPGPFAAALAEVADRPPDAELLRERALAYDSARVAAAYGDLLDALAQDHA